MHALGRYKVEMSGRHSSILSCTPVRDLFCRYVAGDYGNVKMGNTSYSKIAGIRDICLKINVGCTLVLKRCAPRT